MLELNRVDNNVTTIRPGALFLFNPHLTLNVVGFFNFLSVNLRGTFRKKSLINVFPKKCKRESEANTFLKSCFKDDFFPRTDPS